MCACTCFFDVHWFVSCVCVNQPSVECEWLFFSLCICSGLLAKPVILLIALMVKWKPATVSCWGRDWNRNGYGSKFHSFSPSFTPCPLSIMLPPWPVMNWLFFQTWAQLGTAQNSHWADHKANKEGIRGRNLENKWRQMTSCWVHALARMEYGIVN